MDESEAKVFIFSPENRVKEEKLRVHHHLHHQHSNRDEKKHGDVEKYYHELAEKLHPATEVLLVGPGLGKTHFIKHLEKHHHADLAKKIVGVETMDRLTDPQILAAARAKFKAIHLF